VGKEQISIDRKITLDEFTSLIAHEKNSRVLKRLYFSKFRYLGDPIEEAAIKLGVAKKSGYYWQEDWVSRRLLRLDTTFLCRRKVQAYGRTNDRIKKFMEK